MKSYITVSSASEVELIIKKSRFICRAFPVSNEERALLLLADIKKKHYDATHNCYAYRIGENADIARYSDDGEPSGTAGMPMMEALSSIGATNTLVVVTRYFGGILLGAGGLVRAYSSGASDAVKAASLIERVPGTELSVSVDYRCYSVIEPLLKSHAQLVSVDYSDRVIAVVAVSAAESDAFISLLTEKTDGRAQISASGERYLDLLLKK